MLKIKIKEKKFKNKQLLKDTSCELTSGIYILTGSNGVGKTTLLNMVYQQEEFDGEIKYLDQNIKNIEKQYYRRNIVNFVVQSENFFENFTVNDILKLFNITRNEAFQELVDGFNLNYIFVKNREFSKCSGGEKQKIRILVGCMSGAPILILDEPENNLDNDSLIYLNKYLIKRGGIIIITAHNYQYSALNSITIEDKKIIVKKEDSQAIVSITQKENDYLLNKSIKTRLFFNNIFSFLFVCISLAIAVFGVFLLANNLSSTISQGIYKTESTYNSNAVITSPVMHPLFSMYATDEWIEKTPFLFDQEFYETLAADYRITYIQPLGSNGLGNDGLSDGTTFEQIIDYTTLDYAKYGLEEFEITQSNSSISHEELLAPQKVLKNIEPNLIMSTNINDIIYGEFPKDQSDEILIDVYLAMHFAKQNNYDTLEQLIGSQVTLPSSTCFDGSVCDEQIENTYTVSGIYKPEQFLVKDYESQVYVSYDIENEIVIRNSVWMDYETENRTNELNAYDKIKSRYENRDLVPPTFDEFIKAQSGFYPKFYLEFKDEKAEEEIVEQLRIYDPYIEINSEYAAKNSSSFIYVKQEVIKQVTKLIIFLIFIITMIYYVSQFYFHFINEVIIKLNFYGFDEKQVNGFYKFYQKLILRTNFIMMLGLNIGLLLLLEFNYYLVASQILITIIMMLFLAKIFKRKVQKND